MSRKDQGIDERMFLGISEATAEEGEYILLPPEKEWSLTVEKHYRLEVGNSSQKLPNWLVGAVTFLGNLFRLFRKQ